MAATDIKSVLELLRAKVHSADSSTSLDDLNNMVKAAQLAHTPMVRHYDSDGLLPIATSSEERLAFITSTGSIKMNNGRRWESTTSTPSGGGSSFTMLGSSYGYAAGSMPPSNRIERYSFVSDGNATDVGDMISSRKQPAGLSSSDAGYRISSGNSTGQLTSEKMLFASEASSSTSAVTANRSGTASLHSADYGWLAGNGTEITKYAYTADTFSAETPTLAGTSYNMTGASSGTAGYAMGGYPFPGSLGGNAIQKFPFASEAVTESGHLLQSVFRGAGTSSETDGYHAGGQVGPPWTYINVIQKFPFSSDGDTTDVGDLDAGRYKSHSSGNQSAASGYDHGGLPAPSGTSNVIQKFPFSSNGNATDVGDLVTASYGHANNFV